MSAIRMTCQRCGATIATPTVAEAVRWDVSHDEVCPVLTSEPSDSAI